VLLADVAIGVSDKEGVGGRRVRARILSRAQLVNSGRFRAESAAFCPEFAARQLASNPEMSGYLVGSAAFKAVGTGDPRPAGSIPVHLRQRVHGRPLMCFESALTRAFAKFDARTFVTVCEALLAHQSGRGVRGAHCHSSAFALRRHGNGVVLGPAPRRPARNEERTDVS
jgi:hypothetical protein